MPDDKNKKADKKSSKQSPAKQPVTEESASSKRGSSKKVYFRYNGRGHLGCNLAKDGSQPCNLKPGKYYECSEDAWKRLINVLHRQAGSLDKQKERPGDAEDMQVLGY